MRLQEVSLFVAANSLAVIAVATLVTAFTPAEPAKVMLADNRLELPEFPAEPDEPVLAVPVTDSNLQIPAIALPSTFDDIQVIPLGVDPVTKEFTIVTLRLVPDLLWQDFGEVTYCITVYRCANKPKIGWDLELLTSRNIKYDAGWELLNNNGVTNYRPEYLRKFIEQARKK